MDISKKKISFAGSIIYSTPLLRSIYTTVSFLSWNLIKASERILKEFTTRCNHLLKVLGIYCYYYAIALSFNFHKWENPIVLL
jgi:hypothetical protein